MINTPDRMGGTQLLYMLNCLGIFNLVSDVYQNNGTLNICIPNNDMEVNKEDKIQVYDIFLTCCSLYECQANR